MKTLRSGVLFFLSLLLFAPLAAQERNPNPNRLDPAHGVILDASSEDRDYPLRRLYDHRNTMRWETNDTKSGVWLRVGWEEEKSVKELWFLNKPQAFDLLLDLDLRTADFPAVRKIRLKFSDGTEEEAELRLADYFQIITLPEAKTVSHFTVQFESLWDNSKRNRTGLGKLRVYSEAHRPEFGVEFFDMYRMLDDKPVQSAKIRIVNPGEEITGAQLQVRRDGKAHALLDLDTIPARSVTVQQLWVPVVYEPARMHFSMRRSGAAKFAAQEIDLEPYQKNYFDGGVFHILSTNHNDLGFQDTQFKTADYRSRELIGPALDLMRDHPEYTYHMESVEYIKEFLARYPQRRDELAERMREGRFSVGASYVQNLHVHVGPEKLVRQFYYGRRWLRENFPGCDTRFYSNVDVPVMTGQFPQILKKSGIDYMIQGRFPWGFYYWEGLDGTVMPLFALRYTNSYMLLNPLNNTGWLRFQNIRESYYRTHELPRSLIYDFNCDYLPPAPAMIPFVKEQNREMKAFAADWNKHFEKAPDKQITPPVLRFTPPAEALDSVFGSGQLENAERMRGDWPLQWAYFDEPGHREGLLMGRLGHNRLLKAERIFAWLATIDPTTEYPKERLEQGWLANCWPDHGWGGNHGVQTDSINVASYRTSMEIGTALADRAGALLAGAASADAQGGITLLVYNASNWQRDDVVAGTVNWPVDWTGMQIVDAEGNDVPYELTAFDLASRSAGVAFEARAVPPLGYRVYYARPAAEFTGRPVAFEGSVLENDYLRVHLSGAGIASLYDKVGQQEILNTEKFAGAEVIRFSAPTRAWDGPATVTTEDFDRTANHATTVLRTVKTPVRSIVEQETVFPDFTLLRRYILNRNARELIVEADLVEWKGVRDRELRIVYPMNFGPAAQISYEAPFGTVEKGRDEADFSHLPETTECQYRPAIEAMPDLPFREAINWVDVSDEVSAGCLLASDITLHLFRDQSDNPVDYPLVQHVLLSSRKSLAWNPDDWFTQAGDHAYRMALYPHGGNWRYAYRNGIGFNNPLTLYAVPSGSGALPVAQSFLEVGPENLVVTAVKQAEDGDGLFVRLYEAEGKPATLRLKGFQPFSKVMATDMIEYDEAEVPLSADGTVELTVEPWEILNLRIKF